MRSGNILQFSKSWTMLLVLLLLFTSLSLVASKMGVSKEVGEMMLMFEEEDEGKNLMHPGDVRFDFKEVGSEDLEMINEEEEEEGWKEKVDNDTADAKIEESDGDEQIKGGRSEESTGLSGQQIQEEEKDYQQESRIQDLGLSGQIQDEDEEEEERVFVSNTDPWLQYRYTFALLFCNFLMFWSRLGPKPPVQRACLISVNDDIIKVKPKTSVITSLGVKAF